MNGQVQGTLRSRIASNNNTNNNREKVHQFGSIIFK